MPKQEAIELLEAINTKLDSQGQVVDSRMLDKKGLLEKLIKEYETEGSN
jgi:hypothetical protein